MYQFLTKNGQAAAFGLGLIITVLFYVMASGGENVDFGIYAAVGLTVLCFLAMLVFGILQVATNPKGALKGLVGIGAMIVIFFIGYSAFGSEAGTENMEGIFKEFDISPGESGYINGAIVTGLAMMIISVVVFFGSEVRNFFK